MVATQDDIFALLREVKDPELPMLDVVELGIVRAVRADAEGVQIDITPTYTACPAMRTIEEDIVTTLSSHGLSNVSVRMVYAPAWTTDWMTAEAKEKLRAAGIAPPGLVQQEPLIMLRRIAAPVACPFCGSTNTEERSVFGSTACKAIHYCNACHQPFDEFKAL